VYWDLNGNTAGAGATSGDATGTWNATNPYWNSAAAGTDATMAWTGGTATFAAGTDANSSYTVTVEGTRDIGGLTFEEGSVTLSPGTAGGLRMTANSLLSVATGLTATVATPISQDATARSLTKAGAGTLVLSVNNTYTGATTITSGTLLVASLASAGSDSPIGNYPTAGAAGLSLNGGTLQYTGGSVTSDRGFTLAATSTVDLAAGTALTLGDCSMGAYTLNVTGGSGSSLGLGAVTLTGAATLNPTTASLTVASVAATNQNLTLGGTATGSAVTGGIATGSGTVTKNGTGTWTLSGTNTWTGQTTISAGTLVFAGASTLPPAAAQIGVGNGGTLRLQQDGGGVTVNNLCNSGGRGIVATYEADRQTPGSGDGLNYVFTKTCYNIDTGSTLNVQAGPNITSGTPTVDFSNASGSRGLMCWDSDIGNAAVVATGVNLRINGITGGNLKVLTLSGTSAGSEVYGVMDFGASVAGGLTKAGTGTWTLSGVNTYTGPTTVNSGTLALSGTGDVNSSSGITLNGPTAVFMQNSSVANSRTFTLTQGTLGGTGTISTAITSGASVTIAPGDRTLASPAAGTLTIANDVNLTDGTTTEMRLFSTAANDSDKLWQTTTGGLGYGGILKIIAVNSLAFAVGNNWDLFDFDSQSGLFSNDSEFGTVGGTYLPLLTADKKWSFAYTTGVLSVVSGLFPGDTNGDFVVDAADYIAIKTNFGLSGLGITRLQGDLIDNDVVDWADLQELMNAMATRTVPGAPAAPEPATLGLLAIGALAVLRRRRRS
jgi:autotransporter-associated beta strand protein